MYNIWQPNNLCGGEIIREHCVQKYHSYKAESVRKTIYLSSFALDLPPKLSMTYNKQHQNRQDVEFIDRSKEYRSNASYGLIHTHCMVWVMLIIEDLYCDCEM